MFVQCKLIFIESKKILIQYLCTQSANFGLYRFDSLSIDTVFYRWNSFNYLTSKIDADFAKQNKHQ